MHIILYYIILYIHIYIRILIFIVATCYWYKFYVERVKSLFVLYIERERIILRLRILRIYTRTECCVVVH